MKFLHIDTSPDDLKSEVGRAPEEKKRSGEVGGGRAGHHHLLAFRRTLSMASVRAQAKLLLNRLEASPRGDRPSGWITAAAGRRSFAINLERRMANQRRADQPSRLEGKDILRRG